MIRCKIDVTKIDKAALFEGRSGAKYLDLTLMENRGGPDKYGNDYMIVQDLGKAAREAGKRGAILGNGKTIGPVKPARPAPPEDRGESTTVWNRPTAGGASGVSAPADDSTDLPF